jgi:hypothetical protein
MVRRRSSSPADRPVSLNPDAHLYVIPAGPGYSCLGYAVLEHKLAGLLAWLGVSDTTGDAPGTLARYDFYLATLKTVRTRVAETGLRCSSELHPALIGLEGHRVEIEQYGERRRVIVGITTGWVPAHLGMYNRRAIGSSNVLDAASTRLIRVIERVR